MNPIKILETNVLHASDVIYWLDGASAENIADMQRLTQPVTMQLRTRPRDLQFLHTAGKTALWRQFAAKIVDGEASEQDKQRPPAQTFTVAGTVSDPAGRYIPRDFNIDVGSAAGHGLVLYPTPLGTRFGRAGGLLGTLRYMGSETPVPWALLTLRVTLAVGDTLVFRAQSNGHGDFMLSMDRLPPLPEGIGEYAAQLSIQALADASPDTPVDPDGLEAMQFGDLEQDAVFDTIEFSVSPGRVRQIKSFNKDYLAVQPH